MNFDIENWKQYEADIKKFLQSKVSNVEDVEDIFQDFFMKIFNRIHTLSEKDKLKPWLFQVMNHIIRCPPWKAKGRGG